MPQRARNFKLLKEILYRQRLVRRTHSSHTALRTIAVGLQVKIQRISSKLLPLRGKRFQKAVDIFITSSLKRNRSAGVNEPSGSRTTMSRAKSRTMARMASKFVASTRTKQSPYLNSADLLEARNRPTICSDPFLLFLQDFTSECAAIRTLERQDPAAEPATSDIDDDFEEGDANDPVLEELPSKDQLLSVAWKAWCSLSDKSREPYRFRAITAALFPAAIDQAF
ncbi:uncharacterized protein LOC128724165 [Anopheles nili]|uniref:uncharacterized protein LOC128724165 n=1 Tax=Anopheles nili TaxID=185578 RepID=UPI00237A4975|nr:uncharacterized protein LOC128724165 [Anopheles nili]